jgi:hypothetical protein
VGDASPASAQLRRIDLRSGMAVQLPRGWRLLRRPVTACSDPIERFAAASFPASQLGRGNALPRAGALILLLEDHINPASAFPIRPRQFRLRARATTFEGCCDTPSAPGYEFTFRDHGHHFEAFLFRESHAPRKLLDQAMSVLNSLQVAGPATAA